MRSPEYIVGNFPSVIEYEIPAYLADYQVKPPGGMPYLKLPADETVYTMWIGTSKPVCITSFWFLTHFDQCFVY